MNLQEGKFGRPGMTDSGNKLTKKSHLSAESGRRRKKLSVSIYVINMRKRSRFIYLAGMIPVIFVAGLLAFLALSNLLLNRAVYGDSLGDAYEVEGLAAILVNLGILGLVGWLGSYMAFLFNRTPRAMLVHRIIGVVSCVCIVAGLAYAVS